MAQAKVLAIVLALVLTMAGAPRVSEASFVRASCRGVQELSMSESRVSCEESSVLDDGEHLMLGHTMAAASLEAARLSSSATGGQIRGVGFNGGEAGAALMDRITVVGDWQGELSVTVRLCVSYTFAGFGESRVQALLRASPGVATTYASQARVRIAHRGFGGAALENLESHGTFVLPEPGPRPARSVFELAVTERIRPGNPVLSVRADLATHALPNLDALEPVLSSFAEAVAWVSVSVPPSFGISSESGVFPRTRPGTDAERASAKRSWGIIAASDIGSGNALRDHRRWYRAAAGSDCRQQLGVDG